MCSLDSKRRNLSDIVDDLAAGFKRQSLVHDEVAGEYIHEIKLRPLYVSLDGTLGGA